MLHRSISLLLAFALLGVNLLSVDYDGGAFEGKGIETAVVYRATASKFDLGNELEAGASPTRYVALGEGQSVSAFEVPFTLISKYAAPPLYVPIALPAPFASRIHVHSISLICLSVPRSPPRQPTEVHSISLRAPPLSLTPFA